MIKPFSQFRTENPLEAKGYKEYSANIFLEDGVLTIGEVFVNDLTNFSLSAPSPVELSATFDEDNSSNISVQVSGYEGLTQIPIAGLSQTPINVVIYGSSEPNPEFSLVYSIRVYD
jgi:hypothetical protein